MIILCWTLICPLSMLNSLYTTTVVYTVDNSGLPAAGAVIRPRTGNSIAPIEA